MALVPRRTDEERPTPLVAPVPRRTDERALAHEEILMNYRTMSARFPGSCRGCASPIKPGDLIVSAGRGRTYHQDCNGTTRVTTIYFPSTGQTVYRNANGTCEDAPCCGCCT